MKYIVGLIILIGFSSQSNAQFGFGSNFQEVDSCYFRWITVQDGDTVKRIRMTKNHMRYAEWECGKEVGIADCNSELTYDQDRDLVYKQSDDRSNTEGDNKPFSGTCESCHMNGRIQRRVTFVNGKENGIDTTFYESGCPNIIRSLALGKENGTSSFMFDSTQFLAWRMNHYMGEKDGEQIYFSKPFRNESGKWQSDTTKQEFYSAGVLNGVKRTYYRGGSACLNREATYKQGVFHGPFRIYNRDRIIIEELNYKDGKKDQECNYYYEDGTLLKTESWLSGVKNGEFKIFYYQGDIQVSENYKKGLKEGWFEEFYPDKTSKNRKFYKKDVLVEEHRYDEHGRETYSFGTPTGDNTEDDQMPSTDPKAAAKAAKSKAKAEKKRKKAEAKAAKKKAKEEK